MSDENRSGAEGASAAATHRNSERGTACSRSRTHPGQTTASPRRPLIRRWAFAAALVHGVAILLTALIASPVRGADAAMSLDGTWRFELDRADAGVPNRWFERELAGKVVLPGSLPAHGIGEDVSVETQWTGGIVDRSWFTAPEYAPYRQPGNVKVPFWLQPDKYYVGAAWYQREISIPKSWVGRRVVLFLERAHFETRLWLDARLVGTNNSLSTPHVYELGVVAGSGAKAGDATGVGEESRLPRLSVGSHRLTIRVDNRLVVDVGDNSHSVSDHTQGNWNGIVGTIRLQTTPPVWIDDLQTYPDLAKRSVLVRGQMGNATGQAGSGTLTLRIEEAVERGMIPRPAPVARPVKWNKDGGAFEFEIPVAEEPKLWDEFHPNLYNLEARLEGTDNGVVVMFGFREISTQGTQFLVNGRKTFFRGTLECAIFPKTGHTPTDLEIWRKVIRAAKAHGLNNLRFHSHCPPEAAFAAADELGMYLHVECASWANDSTTLGDGKPVDAWVYEEADRILRAYGNHPSFVLMLYGNEPGGRNHIAYLKQWVAHYRAKDPRRLWSSAAGWPQIPENQFHVAPDPRIQAWGAGLRSRVNALPPETRTDYRDYIAARPVPVISHEIGQWCVYPNFEEIAKYTGYLKPRNFEIFRDTLQAKGMTDLAPAFLQASGKLQTLCYKEDIESALRTPGMGGFQLLDLHDFPGQGTALVGVLDPFWEGKGYVTPEEYRRFCNAVVPLARLSKRVFTSDERLVADIEVANFGATPLTDSSATWWLLKADGLTVMADRLPARDIPIDNGISLGRVEIPLETLPAPARYRLVVGLDGPAERSESGTAREKSEPHRRYDNDWDFWVYPTRIEAPEPAEVMVVDALNDRAVLALRGGRSVLFTVPPGRIRGDRRGKVELGFSSIFWNTAWTRGQAPHTLGILCDPQHPMFAQFPTEAHSNWQWWYLIRRADAMILDDLPGDLRPTVRVIDDWFTNRRLGLVFEAQVEGGKLVVCSMDLLRNLETDPVARQFRQSLLRYMASDRFRPQVKMALQAVLTVLKPPSALARLGAEVARVSSAEPGYGGELAIDGDPATMWHTVWTGGTAAFPHELVIRLREAVPMRGLVVQGRQDGNRNGWVKDFEIYVSATEGSWGEPVVRGTLPPTPQPQTIVFPTPQATRFIRFVGLSGHAQGPWASIAELEVLPDRP